MAFEAGRFFVLMPDTGSPYDTEFEKAEPVLRGEAPRCELCGKYLGMKRWRAPKKARLILHGDRYGDFAFASSSEFLLSEKATTAFKAASLRGLSDLERVEIVGTHSQDNGEPRPIYYYGTILLSNAVVNESRSAVVRSSPVLCDACSGDGIDAVRGFALDVTGWSGEDVFFARGLPGIVIASTALVNMIKKHRLTNARFVPTESYEWIS